MTSIVTRLGYWAPAIALATLAAGCRSGARPPRFEPGPAREEVVAAPRTLEEPAVPVESRHDSDADAAAEAEPASAFEVDASLTYYSLPSEDDFVMAVVQVDREALHVEARYNYEDRDTGSLFLGWNWGVGEDLRLDATLMAGAVAGESQGFAPGYRLSLGWRFLEFTSEAEFLVSTESSDEDFFYSWSELSAAPIDWLFFGVALQRLRPVESDLEVDFGPFAGVAFGAFDFSAYVMNPGDDDDAYYVFSLGASF